MINDPLQSHSMTPFGARKTAEQTVQFAMDPSFGLTREQYQWFKNSGSLNYIATNIEGF